MLAAAVPLPTLVPQSEAAIQASFQPAEVLRVAFPKYPSTTVAIGTVVLEITLSETGKAGEVKVLRDIPPLTEEAKAAVGDWQFMAATLNGDPVRSKIVLAFVFNTIATTR
jgi:outer membrane biosynthesis protein TonB